MENTVFISNPIFFAALLVLEQITFPLTSNTIYEKQFVSHTANAAIVAAVLTEDHHMQQW